MLRDYQKDVLRKIRPAGNGLLVLPTGAGKTYTFTSYIQDRNVPTAVIAHRQELVGQMSLALAQLGVVHRLIASDAVITEIMKAHRAVLGKVFYDPTAPIICASVDTLIRRRDPVAFGRIKQWVIDEAHHVLRENKWGAAVELFPNAAGLGVTATPLRADGKGLGRHADGVFDYIVEGPTGDELIKLGYLSPYEIDCPSVDDLDYADVETGKTGDFKAHQLRTATKRSRKLIGSMVGHYQRQATGRLGITFCVDIEHAEETAAQYHEAGISAAVVTSKTPFLSRVMTMERFKRREILQLVNVDLFGEGVDVPGVEVVTMGRKTASFGLYSQQFGRALRPVYHPNMPLDTAEQRRAAIAAGPKPYALIVDHVGNLVHHLLPTAPRDWSLDAREKRGAMRVPPEDRIKTCTNHLCFKAYRSILIKCPYCGHMPVREPVARAAPQEVEGDLERVDLDVLRALQAASLKVNQPLHLPRNITRPAALSIMKHHAERAAAQAPLRDTIARWAGFHKASGLLIPEIQKLFYAKFNIDVLTAQSLGARAASELQEEVTNDIVTMEQKMGYPAGGDGRPPPPPASALPAEQCLVG